MSTIHCVRSAHSLCPMVCDMYVLFICLRIEVPKTLCTCDVISMGLGCLCCRRRPKPEVELNESQIVLAVWAVRYCRRAKRLARRKDFSLAGQIRKLNKRRKELTADLSLEGQIRKRQARRRCLEEDSDE